MRRFGLALLLLSCAACGDDDGPGGGAGNDASTNVGTGGQGGTGGNDNGGNGGSGAGGKAAGASGKGAGGTSSSGAGGDDGGGEADGGAGSNATGQGTTCKAPVVADKAGNECPVDDPVALKATLVKDGFAVPVFVGHAPGDANHLYVLERRGTIQMLDLDTKETSMFLDLRDRVISSSGDGEMGLLGLAFHPDFPKDPRFFLNFTTDAEGGGNAATTHIAAFEVKDDVGDMSSETVLLDFQQPQANHNGGMLAFGPDGCLFAGAGDGGNSNDVGNGHTGGGNGQSLDTPLGKILRIDVDDPKKAAPGNLGMGLPQIWDYGTRNPWRFSFDRKTGDLYIGDVGQNLHEEVDVEPKGDGHKNYGWPIMEGLACLGGSGCKMDGLTLPITAYDHVNQQINSITGGYVYRGSAIPSLDGWYVYADHAPAHRIYALVWDGKGTCAEPLELDVRDGITVDSGITSFGEDGAGELYLTTHTGVYRIEAK